MKQSSPIKGIYFMKKIIFILTLAPTLLYSMQRITALDQNLQKLETDKDNHENLGIPLPNPLQHFFDLINYRNDLLEAYTNNSVKHTNEDRKITAHTYDHRILRLGKLITYYTLQINHTNIMRELIKRMKTLHDERANMPV